MVVCSKYDFKLWHVLFPPPHTLYKICIIRDKSKLFLTSFLRILFYLFIFDYLHSNGYIMYKDGKNNRTKRYGFIMLLVVLVINILILVLVLIKTPLLDQDVIEQDAVEEVTKIDADPDTKSGLETRTLGRTETEKIFMPEVLEVPGRPKSIS